MPRYRLVLEYGGTPFVGWQRQDNGPSVQAALEEAIFRFCQERVTVTASGRTDAGVHALGQVVHFDLAKEPPAERVREALNYHLQPDPVAVLVADVASPEFHARLSATSRAYLYRILNRRPPPTVERNRVWHVQAPLDAEAMHHAAQALVGHHDFTTFRASLCQAKSAEKTLDRLDISRAGEEIHVNARARSFLHHQVRNMVGTLRLAGEGKWNRADVENALAARNRSRGGPTAPPDGLYLVEVRY
ncbi:MAG: tRNA pseudouridine(38-40) synthase TruA [Rhodospirillales bacterium]|nr:tRNA pseudouridine(38-40) synthase TruA [Rhodospirillales bacterium]